MAAILQGILDFFTYVWDLIRSLGETTVLVTKLVFNLLKDLPLFVKLTTAFSADLPQYLNWLPASVVSIITLTIALVIVYKFFGRT